MLIRVLLPLSFIVTLAACNTMQGVGEDVSTAGQAISGEAQQQQF
jgi:predicted small secreted protein